MVLGTYNNTPPPPPLRYVAHLPWMCSGPRSALDACTSLTPRRGGVQNALPSPLPTSPLPYIPLFSPLFPLPHHPPHTPGLERASVIGTIVCIHINRTAPPLGSLQFRFGLASPSYADLVDPNKATNYANGAGSRESHDQELPGFSLTG